jgi:CheY-like chemotaxis protein
VQNDLVVIMVVEDDQLIEGVLEEALSEGGCEMAIATVGGKAVTLLQDKQARYRAFTAVAQLLNKSPPSAPDG